jgi:hypothetical protein
MISDTLGLFEVAVSDLIAAFDVKRPPVPVELMLQRPRPGLWNEVNLSELSTTFISIKERYSPRMSVARLLARHICRCAWGANHHLAPFANSEDDIHLLARAIVMPASLLAQVSLSNRAPLIISTRFEVPEKDAYLRLVELGYLPPS